MRSAADRRSNVSTFAATIVVAVALVVVAAGCPSRPAQLTDADSRTGADANAVRFVPGTYEPLPEPEGGALALQAAIARAIKAALPTVVTLRIETDSPFGPSYGSGVIVDSDGFILTNDHVVEDATEIEALLVNYETYSAEVVGRDPFTDLAVLRINGAGALPAIPIGDSDACYLGQIVLAFGNPFGISFKDAQPTVTMGIIGALNRVSNPQGSYRLYRRAIQHDAAINPGNSGGPLVNLRGELIGINGVISSATGQASGISFAIPSRTLLDVLPALKAGEAPQHSWVGIGELTNVVQQPDNGPGRRGVQVGFVLHDSPAEEAGVRPGDIIVAAADSAIHGKTEFINWLADIPAGSEVVLHVFRPDGLHAGTGTYLELTVTVGERPQYD